MANIATPRAIGFDPIAGTKKFLGHRRADLDADRAADQAAQVVDRCCRWAKAITADSPHYDDQSEEVVQQGKMKPTYFLDKDELLKHVESKTVVVRTVP